MLAQGVLAADQQQSRDGRKQPAVLPAHEAAGAVELRVLQAEESSVSVIGLDRPPQALAFQGVEILSRSARDRQSRVVRESEVGFPAGELVGQEWHAVGSPVGNHGYDALGFLCRRSRAL